MYPTDALANCCPGRFDESTYRNPSGFPPQRRAAIATKERLDHVAGVYFLAELFWMTRLQLHSVTVDEQVGAEHATGDFLAVGAVADSLGL